MSYTCIRIEGGLISPDFLETIHEQEGQKPSDFGLDPKRSIVDEVSSVWADARIYWTSLQQSLEREKDKSETTLTRKQWVIPLLESLGYQLTFQRKAPEVDGRAYPISHIAGSEELAPPVHIVETDQELGSRPPAGRGTMSPHALVQDYLNRTEPLWGAVTNGRVFRLLRDSSYFSRPTYIEFDLEQMLEGERLDEFFLFYRLAHRTRLPEGIEDAPRCLLERYHQDAIEQGGRIREGLRDAVEAAILKLGNGFLMHPRNKVLREGVAGGALTADSYYKQLLYLIYRMLFLVVAEERGLLSMTGKRSDEKEALYSEYFSFARLRKLADTPLSAPGRFDDLYLGFRGLAYALRDDKLSDQLGLPPLNGELFNPLADLEESFISNERLLEAVAAFSYFTAKNEKVRRRINYAALDVEELGSVYESLLEYQPVFVKISAMPEFDFVAGTGRKTTGSYYTRPELVKELVNSALVPVIGNRLADARKAKQDEEKALLSIRVCDPACGSGHFLLAATRRIAYELAKVRTLTEEPSPDTVRAAARDVITHCVYGVDRNPLAVDLCKVALWIEGHGENKPLTFLDHRIRCGDSLVGVLDMQVLKDGIPEDAYNPVTGDDKKTAKSLKQQNKGQRLGGRPLPFDSGEEEATLTELLGPILELTDDTPESVRRKRKAFESMYSEGTKLWHDEAACNMWTGAFFSNLTDDSLDARQVPTTDDLWSFMENEGSVDARLPGRAWQLQSEHRFFHWPLVFPDVFESGGFDVVMCNPPWEMIQLEEQQFFASKDFEIAGAPNKAARQKLIKKLPESNPALWREYQNALHYADALSKFFRLSGRFPLTGRGRINTYSVFAELFRELLGPRGRAGILCPTGIATDDTNKLFFGDIVDSQNLISLIGFENEAFMFPAIHHSTKFCELTIGGKDLRTHDIDFAFFCRTIGQVQQDERHFTLSKDDIRLINPNTLTCPVFRTKADAELTKKIYERVPVLVNEKTGENPWGVSFKQGLFNMSSDSHLFRTQEQLEREGYHLSGNRYIKGDDVLLPLYEAKMIWHFDHRYATYEGATQANLNAGILPKTTPEQKSDSHFVTVPRYWVSESDIDSQLPASWRRKWLIGFRDTTSAVVERTAIMSLMPLVGVGHKLPLVFAESNSTTNAACFLACFNSLVLDYITRQKIGGTSLSYFILKQLPFLPLNLFNHDELEFIVPRVLELVYTSMDLKEFADSIWEEADSSLRTAIQNQSKQNRTRSQGNLLAEAVAEEGTAMSPFWWDKDRRARLRAELDAYYAKLYGLTEEELRYILDPSDVYGPDFPGETFRVLKEKEMNQFGEYRTQRMVLEAFAQLNHSGTAQRRNSTK